MSLSGSAENYNPHPDLISSYEALLDFRSNDSRQQVKEFITHNPQDKAFSIILLSLADIIEISLSDDPIPSVVPRETEADDCAEHGTDPGEDDGEYHACRGVGVECLSVENDAEIDDVLRQAKQRLAEDRPVALDVAIDYTGKTYFTRGVVKTNLLRLSWPERLRMVTRALVRRLAP